MSKWIALGMIAIGIALAIRVLTIEPNGASYEDGSFLYDIIMAIIAVVAVVGGLVWLGVLLFTGSGH